MEVSDEAHFKLGEVLSQIAEANGLDETDGEKFVEEIEDAILDYKS